MNGRDQNGSQPNIKPIMARGGMPKLAVSASIEEKQIQFVKQMKIGQEGIWKEGMSH